MQDSLQLMMAIQNNSIDWIEVLTGLLVIVTIMYAYFTYRMMKASEKAVRATKESIDAIHKQMEASLRPYIDFKLERFPNNYLYLHIRNSGKINAEKLSLSLDRDFHPLGNSGKKNLKEATLFKNEIASFAPGTEVTVGMLEIGEIGKVEDVAPAKFKIIAKYSWTGRKEPIIEENEIDLTSFVGSGLIPKPDLLYEVNEIKSIFKNIEKKLGAK